MKRSGSGQETPPPKKPKVSPNAGQAIADSPQRANRKLFEKVGELERSLDMQKMEMIKLRKLRDEELEVLERELDNRDLKIKHLRAESKNKAKWIWYYTLRLGEMEHVDV